MLEAPADPGKDAGVEVSSAFGSTSIIAVGAVIVSQQLVIVSTGSLLTRAQSGGVTQ